MEGVKQIIDECWKIIKNPQEHECKAMEAMQIALKANVQLCNMLKTMKAAILSGLLLPTMIIMIMGRRFIMMG